MSTENRVGTPVLPTGPRQQGNSIIHTRGMTKIFNGEVAVENVDLDIPQGTIFGFIGPSGSGKTTSIRMLTGVYRPTEGVVEVFGEPPYNFSQSVRARMGYMPQLFVLYPDLSVWENLNFAASIYGMSLRRGKRLREVLDFVELKEHSHKLARNISGGMQRRLSLASTLAHDPDLIFLDEPTAGVDPVLRSKFWDQFRALRDSGRTLFVTTQYVSEAAYCDMVGVMGEGRLIEIDTPTGLRHKAFGGDIVDLRTKSRIDYQLQSELRDLPFVIGPVIRTGDDSVRLTVDEARSAVPDLMDWTQSKNIGVDTIEEYQPPFDDVFVKLVQRSRSNG